ncbi:MAG TPA: D-2-hydroxyacid dehydrogenase [Saprospiraceae bacterium]|nr:D-2-hydroxyacid dehydrogenase [Saprospiraceae bacterium]HPK10324.1 D-2-hydroxyacid dehydrogenase [Saprospiraceae bacterium]HRX28842.1 D-2-hydroxyacid dehydrogenase [Saprospiraceae bacterium]
MKILINDGIEAIAISMLENAGIEVTNKHIPQEDLLVELPKYDAISVRSATKVRKELIDACPNLKLIGRGGVGLDNIDVEYARSKGIAIVNTPAASSRSVAELVMGHLFTIARGLQIANRKMPLEGQTHFSDLKKSLSKGIELETRVFGIIGFGRIGQEMAKLAIGCGMKVLAYDPYVNEVTLPLVIQDEIVKIQIRTSSFDHLIANSDVISIHTPGLEKPIINAKEIENMKNGVILLNAARGGVIDEAALLDGLNSGKIAGAGLDVFLNEPTPNDQLLTHPKISLSPHIGASTIEAQNKIGVQLAEQIIENLKK